MSRFTREINSETTQINFHTSLHLTPHSILKNGKKVLSHTQMKFLIVAVGEFGWRGIYIYIFYVAPRPNAGHGLLILEVSRSQRKTHHSRCDFSRRVIGPSQRPLRDKTHNRHAGGELSYLEPLGSENISAPYFKQCFFQGGCINPQTVKHHASQSQDKFTLMFINERKRNANTYLISNFDSLEAAPSNLPP